jgi:hypothetical protein
MATAPAFAATAKAWSGLPVTADTSLTAPTNAATILTAGASGSKVDEIIVQGVGTTVAGVVNIFLHDGTTYHLVDQFVITAVTSSATAAAYRQSKQYTNLEMPTGWSLRASQTIAGNASILKVSCLGGDF